MAITYKSVIAQAIGDFNDIQTALHDLGAKYKFDGSVLETIPAISSSAKLVPTSELDSIITEQLILKPTGTYSVDSVGALSSGYYPVPTDISTYQYVKVRAVNGSIGGSATAGSAKAAISNSDSMETITDLTNKVKGTDYFEVKATATGSAGSYTPKYTVNNAGWIASTVTGSAASVTVNGDSTGKSLYIPAATCSLGNSSISSGNIGTISISLVNPSSSEAYTVQPVGIVTSQDSSAGDFYYFKVNAPALSKNITVTSTHTSTAGYLAVVGTRSKDTSLSFSASASGNKYIKVKAAALTGTVSGTSVTPTIAGDTTKSSNSATNLTVTTKTAGIGAITTTVPTSGYYLNIKPSVGTTTATITKSGLTEGYLKDSGQISISGSIAGKTGSNYYIPIDAGTCTVSGGGIASSSCSVSATASSSDIVLTNSANKPTSGYYFTVSGSADVKTNAVLDSHTAGYIPEKSSTTIISAKTATPSATTYYTIPTGALASIEATTTGYDGYTELEDVIIPSEGYLILNAGYYPNSKISLDALLGGKTDTANFTNAGYLRKGYIAYNEDGKKITGTMADVSPTFTVTVTNGTPASSTTITPVSTSPANKGAAVNYNDNKLGGTAEASEYVTITAKGTGGASAPSASSKYAANATGYLNKTSGTAAGTGNGSKVETTSDDTNYIAASSTSSITANAAIITAKASFSNSTSAATNKGTAIHYTDNKLGGSSEASNYVTIVASASGSASAGADKTLTVKDKYMLNNVTVKSAAVTSATTATSATAYIPAHNGGSLTLTSGTITASVDVVQHTDSAANKGFAKCYNSNTLGGSSEATYYVKVEASGSASASAPSGSITVKDKYMLGNISASGGSIAAKTFSNTNYIPAANDSSVTVSAGTITGSVSSPTVGSATTFNASTGAKNDNTKKATITATASATAGNGGTLTIKDKYMLNNITYKGTAIGSTSLTSGTATIAADAMGSNVDTYVEALYKRMLGLTYTEVDADPVS